MDVAFNLLVSGRVQGVGYRASFAKTAQDLGLAGWVRNLRDGRVQAQICGSAEDCEALIAWAHRGPPSARVTAVDVTPLEVPAHGAARAAHAAFEIRPTV